ncbi:kinase-like domain-containing protein [Powellomyces hirtus]|nr:kinase-like domain-containing protein [Powellomyces hirtus]
MDALTAEEINDFYQTFPELSKKFKIVSKIGEGTFSSVYEAVDLEHSEYENGSWQQQTKIQRPDQPGASALQSSKASVALKRIYVTSSPQRIYSEIKILHHLSGHPNIVQLITAIRHEDQVLPLRLPLFRHLDFRDYYLDITIAEIRDYMRALLRALEHVHSHKILHRDVKPSNFLYDPKLGTGVLCDFGLAQREENREHRLGMDLGVKGTSNHLVRPRDRPLGYIINDPRPSIRACRAGTRGFRAPEVLLKVLHQTCAIDIWSAGVILLCIFTGRFPFFEANDDQEAFLEIAHIFGKAAMKEVAAQFERRLDTNIPAINKPITFEDLCWKLHSKRALDIPPEGFDLLRKLMALNPRDRITAAEACAHPFLN